MLIFFICNYSPQRIQGNAEYKFIKKENRIEFKGYETERTADDPKIEEQKMKKTN